MIPPIPAAARTGSVARVTELPQLRRVEVSFVGAPPGQQIARAPGVSRVETHGRVLRCLVYGSFQPFLEALHGHEVVGLESTSLIQEG